MAPSTASIVSAISQWPNTISRRRAICTPPLAQIALSWAPFHHSPLEQTCYVYQDARVYWPCIYHHVARWHQSFLSRADQHDETLSCAELVLVSNACPQCQQRPKHPYHRFCSVSCNQSAARFAPELKYLPPYHDMSMRVVTQFMQCWKSNLTPLPKVLAVYMITWTKSYQRSFERYRDAVETRGKFQRMGCSSGNEQKRFRGTIRACTIGERGNVTPCVNEACWVCETIRLGFEPHLQRKRDIPLNGVGIRLGAGIYTSHSSSKADQYAQNVDDPNSSVKAMLVCRVVIGNPYVTSQEDNTIRQPPPGYDCVFAKPGGAFEDDEYVVYDVDAIRAAYLVLYETVSSA